MHDQALDREVQGLSFVLESHDGCLQLRAAHHPDYGSICADWASAEQHRRISAGRKQLLARAFGLHRKREIVSVLDATAGLGRDGFTLAALGLQVTMTERHPQILALLMDAQQRALRDAAMQSIARRIDIVATDARRLLQQDQHWDAIYLDPMYPHAAKSALPQKEMQLFRELTRGDPDADALLQPARACARRRVVVKRPLRAPWLADCAPTLSLKGTQARFDIYLAATTADAHA
ncbi:MAG: class I SAM-dependent methyltransferase [Stenotrophobium sp.]